ncbi:hypothetical protein ACSCB1_37355 [Streptomyces europaeiscabiei]|uniref:Uncharacterized protein n=1 Tax=Streptomyces europaeiscabiei TaxID=146819 RepID=A0ABU4NUW0_9ACTN|nr:hypothetical protein [Streptomyces europaeiscabiei]MDX2530756.1 hypothetical protein [Streptomyces europaeiscabiei]MDX2762163.1 hypothetical protein [Streptomyces europaeiscabiei]MDX2770101.1 hypothetical protein [Streptomyces europaeiscabiei]MDX3548697.1 hypothetical protein [Streptomyces europaeiscabiei]MDX3558110.1 hypothetical protein [Streptomyces europaeiscabiei]
MRKAALLDRIAVEEGRPEAAVQAEEARALVAQLRAEIEGTAQNGKSDENLASAAWLA